MLHCQVFVYDDDFIKRGGGSRSAGASTSKSTGHQKDAALSEYIGHLNHKKVQKMMAFDCN